MDCKFRILTKDKNSFEKLKKYASGYSKNLLIIDAKCDFLEFLKHFDVEMLITPFKAGVGYIECFYFDGDIKECDDKVLEKFDMSKFEPIKWKKINNDKLPF